MTTAAQVGILFEVEHRAALHRRDLAALAAGVLGGLRVPGFFGTADCAAVMTALDTCEMGSYDEQLVQPRIAKLGPVAYDYYARGELDDSYWAEADAARRIRAGLLHGTDPMDRARELLAAAWGGEVRYATAGGRQMFAGIIREINDGARLHFDEIVREMAGALDELPIAQLAFNCHLSVPAEGGDSVVHRRRWRPADELRRSGYGYHPAIVADEPFAEVIAEVGDAVFFDPRNYHLVRPARGGRRTTLSFFAGVLGDGSLILWS